MSSLEPRSPKRVSRNDREARAFRLAVAGGTFGGIAVVGVVVAVLSPLPMAVPLLAAVAAVICFVLFRRSVGL